MPRAKRPCCPTCGGPDRRPVEPERAFDPDLAVRLATAMLAQMPDEPAEVVDRRRYDLLRDTGGYSEAGKSPAVLVRQQTTSAGGIVRWKAE